ncbi:MAG: LysR family transcriptional regulator [Pseudomonadota bacterium]
MLRSFVVLGRSLNMTRTVEELLVSRQTIRRHINDLEELRGVKLFDFNERKYFLTTEGKQALFEAEVLLQKSENWISKNANLVNGLPGVSLWLSDGIPFHAQRHPLHAVWELAPPVIQRGLNDWMDARAQIQHEAFQQVRDYLIVYRKSQNDWICSEVGEKSSYVSWLGWRWAKSAVGSSFESDPTGNAADGFVLDAYETVARTGGIWYDHISTRLLRSDSKTPRPVNYQRLVLSLMYPNGATAVASLVARTNRIIISGLEEEDFDPMDEEELMEFEI